MAIHIKKGVSIRTRMKGWVYVCREMGHYHHRLGVLGSIFNEAFSAIGQVSSGGGFVFSFLFLPFLLFFLSSSLARRVSNVIQNSSDRLEMQKHETNPHCRFVCVDRVLTDGCFCSRREVRNKGPNYAAFGLAPHVLKLTPITTSTPSSSCAPDAI